MTPKLFSQRDPQWSSLPLGTSRLTIGQAGCTITCIGMKLGISPRVVNDRLNAVDGFAPSNPTVPMDPEKNLVNWTKISQAFPGVSFQYRHYIYNGEVNEVVKKNLPCLVEVDGAPIGGRRHWVLYVGDQKLYDPWDGQVKLTSAYTPLGVAVITGEYAEAVEGNTYKGLNLADRESMKICVDLWNDVKNGQYVKQEAYKELLARNMELERITKPDEDVRKKYNQFVALGYNTVEDVTKALAKANEKILALLRDTATLEKRNFNLATTIAEESKNSYTAIDEALSTIEEAKELKEGIQEIAKVAGADKPNVKDIISNVFRLKDLSNRFIQEKEATQQKQKEQVLLDATEPLKVRDVNWLLSILKGVKGVK